MIQDIAPHCFRNEYRPVPPAPESLFLCYDGRKALLRKDEKERVCFPVFKEVEEFGKGVGIYLEYTYLFSIDEERFYLGNIDSSETPEGCVWEDIQLFRCALPKKYGFAGITGWQLYRWYRSHRFCSFCGQPMVKDEKERMLYCPDCRQMEYPKICPAVIIAVVHGNRLLLSKYAGREYKKYALIAGFAEIGETIEETVRREVMEEVGLKVKNITYYKSQPWSFQTPCFSGFSASWTGKKILRLTRMSWRWQNGLSGRKFPWNLMIVV